MADSRSGNLALSARRSLRVIPIQPAISDPVRPQPRHQPVAKSITQTFVQGLSGFAKLVASTGEVSPVTMGSAMLSVQTGERGNPNPKWGNLGELDGIRTHDPMIKSHVLYRLSYELSPR